MARRFAAPSLTFGLLWLRLALTASMSLLGCAPLAEVLVSVFWIHSMVSERTFGFLCPLDLARAPMMRNSRSMVSAHRSRRSQIFALSLASAIFSTQPWIM